MINVFAYITTGSKEPDVEGRFSLAIQREQIIKYCLEHDMTIKEWLIIESIIGQ